jgi:F0F1-type ATP synthase assembly protein I
VTLIADCRAVTPAALAAGLGLGAAGGWLADYLLSGTQPWLIAVGMVVGALVTVILSE